MEGSKNIMKEVSYLPEEILFHHIFVKLDIDDVTPCEFVCKAWNRVIRDPKFRAMHFKSNPNQCSTKLLMKDDRNVFYSADYNQAIASKTGLLNARKLNSVATTFSENVVLLGSKNGMVLLQISTNKLVLWNPTTRDSKLLCDPDPPISSSDLFGLFYDIAIDDYKIVRISAKIIPRVDVYSLKEDLWKVGKKSHAVRTWYGLLDDRKRCPIELNGVMYWIVYKGCKVTQQSFILGYSLIDEKFVIVELPDAVPGGIESFWGLAAIGKSELATYFSWETLFFAYTMKEPDKNPNPKWKDLMNLNILNYDDGKLTKSIKPVLSYHGNIVLIITFKSSDKIYQKLVVHNPKRNIIFDRKQRKCIYDPNQKVFEEDISTNGIVSIDDIIYTQTLVSPNDFGRKTPSGEQV